MSERPSPTGEARAGSAALVKSKAHELGFTHVGIAEAMPLGKEGARLHEWLSRGYQATMAWMGRNETKRTDPGQVLPGARSVIALAVNYYSPERHSEDRRKGKISRYAWGDDYHDIMAERLEQLRRWLLAEHPEAEAKAYVDTGPVMDKVWAQRAGIGWEGKHTNVITTDMGSWVFLGELLTTLDLEPDSPATDHCGTCTLCIDACPTDAIVEPYVVDSGRCISYLTIEHRGPVEEETASHFEGWIYGCDICQDVCPWNQKFSSPSPVGGFAPRPGSVAPPLDEWREMSEKDFSLRFRRSPVKRTKHAGLMRNVEIVLRNAGGDGSDP